MKTTRNRPGSLLLLYYYYIMCVRKRRESRLGSSRGGCIVAGGRDEIIYANGRRRHVNLGNYRRRFFLFLRYFFLPKRFRKRYFGGISLAAGRGV